MNFSHLFHRSSSGGTQDHRNICFPRGFSSGNLGIRMENALHPDWGQKQRSLEFVTEDSCLEPDLRHSNCDPEGGQAIPPSFAQCSFATYGG